MAEKRIISSPEAFPIQPNHINAQQHFKSAFDNNETEISARWIVRFCQERKRSWQPINVEELTRFYRELRKRPQETFCFNRLIEAGASHSVVSGISYVDGGWLVKQDDDTLAITDDFVNRCFQASPAQKP